MAYLNRLQWLIFTLTCLAIAVVLLFRAWQLHPIYLDSEVREKTQKIIELMSHREGWLLSDIDLRSVDKGGITLLHRSHIRGKDPVTCYRIDFLTASLHQCGG